MNAIERLAFHLKRGLPVILQTEVTECGLACLAMVAGYFGQSTDVASLRKRFPISLKGTTLADLRQFAEEMSLATRPVKLLFSDLVKLRTPCILHWDLNHFVVLRSVGAAHLTIYDPVCGIRRLSSQEARKCFTGIALELWPASGFKRGRERQKIDLTQLARDTPGLRGAFGQILALALVLEVFGVVTPMFMQLVIDQVIVGDDRDLLNTLALGFALLLVFKGVFDALRSWVVLYFGTTMSVQWRSNVFRRLLNLPVQYFEKRHLGDVVSRFDAIEKIQQTLTSSFVEGLIDGVMSVVTLIMMYVYQSTLCLISLGLVVLYGLVRWLWYQGLSSATSGQIVYAARQQTRLLESIRGVKTVKLMGKQGERHASWMAAFVDQVNAQIRTQRLQIYYSAVHAVLSGAEVIITTWFGAQLILDGHFSVGLLTAFSSYRMQFDTRVTGLIDKVFQIRLLRLYIDRLADIVLTEEEKLGSVEENALIPQLEPSICVRDVRFRYGATDPFVIVGASFTVKAGEYVALVGESGCGKTTLMNLILGVAVPTSGDVLIGGMSTKSIGAATVRSMVGTVTQDDQLFSGSIADNISFFDVNLDQPWMEECARRAHIHDEIIAMPMGYSSLVGDMGSALSGGQKQRVLLARALYKRPRILLLDEATAHIDMRREKAISAMVKGLGITTLIVSHRPDIIGAADRRIVLAHGRCREDDVRDGLARGDTKPAHTAQSASGT